MKTVVEQLLKFLPDPPTQSFGGPHEGGREGCRHCGLSLLLIAPLEGLGKRKRFARGPILQFHSFHVSSCSHGADGDKNKTHSAMLNYEIGWTHSFKRLLMWKLGHWLGKARHGKLVRGHLRASQSPEPRKKKPLFPSPLRLFLSWLNTCNNLVQGRYIRGNIWSSCTTSTTSHCLQICN